jgi:xanthine dehydrogenase/oxidase
VSVACALAAQILNRPVRLIMSLESNMEAIGKRCDAAVNYEVSAWSVWGAICEIYVHCSSTDKSVPVLTVR